MIFTKNPAKTHRDFVLSLPGVCQPRLPTLNPFGVFLRYILISRSYRTMLDEVANFAEPVAF